VFFTVLENCGYKTDLTELVIHECQHIKENKLKTRTWIKLP